MVIGTARNEASYSMFRFDESLPVPHSHLCICALPLGPLPGPGYQSIIWCALGMEIPNILKRQMEGGALDLSHNVLQAAR